MGSENKKAYKNISYLNFIILYGDWDILGKMED